ncbi:hypothetical protein [Thermus tenuipuniceus]|uniref:hypothetical protein n=1 Tax=Thermus tenuipuniceus TaxID=2078690 RepID=UPI0013E393BA|nr:hypothetical protein [Thermus tenuipuniceus]
MAAEGQDIQERPKVKLLWPRTGRDWLLLLLATVLVLGIVGNLLPEGPKEVQVGQVRLKVPQGWEAKEVQGGWALLSPLEGPRDTFRENLTLLVEPLPQPINAFQYAQVVAWRNAQGVEGFTPGPVQAVPLGGTEAVAFAGRGRHGGRALEFWVWAFVVGQEGYQLTLTGEVGKLAQVRPQVEGVLASLEVGGGVPGAWPGAGPGVGQGYPPLPSGPAAPGGTPMGGESSLPAPGGSVSEPYGYGPGDVSGGESPPDLSGGGWGASGGFDESLQEHRDFNTWMAEEWSQLLSGETPEPTHQDEAGNLYWEGPSGLLHEWGDYGGE